MNVPRADFKSVMVAEVWKVPAVWGDGRMRRRSEQFESAAARKQIKDLREQKTVTL
jgi:hypothetical protein